MPADNQQQDTSQYTSIFSLAIPAGIKRDGTQFQNDQYTDGVWCRFQRGDPKKMGGYRTLFTSNIGIYRGMVVQPYNGVNYIFAGNYQELDVFTTGINFGTGSGPFAANILPGTVEFVLVSNTASSFVIKGDVTSSFPTGTKVIFNQTTPVTYVTTTATYSAPNTTVNFIGTLSGTPANVWLNNTPVFTGDPDLQTDPSIGNYRVTWQFDAQFSPQGGELSIFAHPGYNLQDIDNGVPSQVLVGNIAPSVANTWNFTGLSDSAGQNPTYKPISVDGGVTVLYPFIFVYGSHGFIANNNVSSTYLQQNFYDWNGPLANQTNVSSSKIVKGMPMRGGTNAPAGLFWATDSLIRVSFNSSASSTTPTSQYWTYDIISSQISIMSSNAIVEMDGMYWWMGVDRFYAYNGSVVVVPNDKNVNYLFDNINYTQRQKVWATKVPRYNEIWFFYPRGTATECTDAIIYNTKDKLWYDAGQATGAQRSCGYTTEIFPTPIWANWNYDPTFSPPLTVIAHPASLPAPTTDQMYIAGDVTPQLAPGTIFAFTNENTFNKTYLVTAAQNIYNTTIGTPGVTLITFTQGEPVLTVPVGTPVYVQSGGFSIWQHEFGQNEVGLNTERAIYSSITTSDISWLTGNPSQDSLVGVNRRMHLRRVEPNFLQTGTMSMTILGRKFANSITEEDSGPFFFEPHTDKIDLRIEHRLMRLKFESNEIDGNYEMGRLMITAEYGDERP
jgi:hypothetical protein